MEEVTECKFDHDLVRVDSYAASSIVINNLAILISSCEYAVFAYFTPTAHSLSYDVSVGHSLTDLLQPTVTITQDYCGWSFNYDFLIYDDLALTSLHTGSVLTYD